MQSLYIQPITYFGEDYRRLSPSDEWLFMNITAEYQTITISFTVQAIKEDRLIRTQKKSSMMLLIELLAEREGFEPPVPLSTVVFKTTVIDHSTILPVLVKSGCKITKKKEE